jgi:hypothetical protein
MANMSGGDTMGGMIGLLQGGPMMHYMAASQVASVGGVVYVLSGDTLQKLGADRKPVKTVDIGSPIPAMQKLEAGNMCSACGRMHEGPPPVAAGATEEQRADAAFEYIHKLHRLMALEQVSLTADEKGVYVLRGGVMTVFDRELKQVSSTPVLTFPEKAADCVMCQRIKQAFADGSVRCNMMSDLLGPPPAATTSSPLPAQP